MSFEKPFFLWSLLLIVIPIIIHLFRFRKYKKIVFTQTFFLEQTQSQQKRIKNLKHLLILAFRISGLSALVLAFALPYFKDNPFANSPDQNSENIVLYIDNHPGFFFKEENKSRLLYLRNAIKRTIHSLGPFNKISIVTNNNTAQIFYKKDDALRYADQIEPFPNISDWKDIFTRIEKTIKNEPTVPSVYLISDFLKRNDNLEDLSVAFTPIKLDPLRFKNLEIIDTLWSVPGTDIIEASADPKSSYRLGNSKKVLFTLEVKDKATDKLSFLFPKLPDNVFGFLESENHQNSILRFYFTHPLKEPKKILIIADNRGLSEPLKSKFTNAYTADVIYKKISDVKAEILQDFKLVVLLNIREIPDYLASALKSFLAENGRLLLCPDKEIDFISYNKFLQQFDVYIQKSEKNFLLADKINYNDALFYNAFVQEIDLPDLPFLSDHFLLKGTGINPVLYTLDGTTLLGKISANGELYLFAGSIEPDNSNLIYHTIFNPLMYNFIHSSVRQNSLYYYAGNEYIFEYTIPRPKKEEPVKILSPRGHEIIPFQRRKGNQVQLFFGRDVMENGIYSVQYLHQELDKLAFNFDLRKLKNDCYSDAELERETTLKKWIKIPFSEDTLTLSGISGFRSELWYLFIWIAILFLLFELLLTRLLK